MLIWGTPLGNWHKNCWLPLGDHILTPHLPGTTNTTQHNNVLHHVPLTKLSAHVAWIWAQTDLYYRSSIVDSLLEISKNVLFYVFFYLSSKHLSLLLKNNPVPDNQPLKLLQQTSGFLQIFGSKIQDCLFSKTIVFFQTLGYQYRP